MDPEQTNLALPVGSRMRPGSRRHAQAIRRAKREAAQLTASRRLVDGANALAPSQRSVLGSSDLFLRVAGFVGWDAIQMLSVCNLAHSLYSENNLFWRAMHFSRSPLHVGRPRASRPFANYKRRLAFELMSIRCALIQRVERFAQQDIASVQFTLNVAESRLGAAREIARCNVAQAERQAARAAENLSKLVEAKRALPQMKQDLEADFAWAQPERRRRYRGKSG